MEERFDVMQSGFWSISSPTATSVHESTTSIDSKEETKKLDNSIANSREINKTSVNFSISPFFNNDESSSTFEIERIALTSSDTTSEGKIERTTDKQKYTEISTLSTNESVTINTVNNFTRNKNGTNIFTRDELSEGETILTLTEKLIFQRQNLAKTLN